MWVAVVKRRQACSLRRYARSRIKCYIFIGDTYAETPDSHSSSVYQDRDTSLHCPQFKRANDISANTPGRIISRSAPYHSKGYQIWTELSLKKC